MFNGFYPVNNKRYIVADCLQTLNKPEMAKKLLEKNSHIELSGEYLAIIVEHATLLKRHDVIEQLQFAGLIYG